MLARLVESGVIAAQVNVSRGERQMECGEVSDKMRSLGWLKGDTGRHNGGRQALTATQHKSKALKKSTPVHILINTTRPRAHRGTASNFISTLSSGHKSGIGVLIPPCICSSPPCCPSAYCPPRSHPA